MGDVWVKRERSWQRFVDNTAYKSLDQYLLSFPLAHLQSYLAWCCAGSNVNLKPCNCSPVGTAPVLWKAVLCRQAQRLQPRRLPLEPISSTREARKLHICPIPHTITSTKEHPPVHKDFRIAGLRGCVEFPRPATKSLGACLLIPSC